MSQLQIRSHMQSRMHPEKILRTRRDFISEGFNAAAGFVLLPSVIGLWMSRAAQARSDLGSRASHPASDLPPFITVDCVGGAAFAGNWLVGGREGPEDLIPSYSTLGWNPRRGRLDKTFGVPLAHGPSQIRQGLLEGFKSIAGHPHLKFLSFCHSSQDDSGKNLQSALQYVAQAGLKGSVFDAGLGYFTSNPSTGGNAGSLLDLVQFRPLMVKTLDDLTQSFKPQGQFAKRPASEGRELLKAMLRHSGMGPGAVSNLLGIGFKKQLELLDHPTQADPREDPVFSKIFGINTAMALDEPDLLRAAVTMNVLRGYVGPSSIVIGGCDYHDNTQSTGDKKDREIGLLLGRLFESAYQLQSPLVVQIVTDGGIYAAPGTRDWTGDSGVRSMTLLAAYHPDKSPTYILKGGNPQIGFYKKGEGADPNTLIGDNLSAVAGAVFANYLSIAGRRAEAERLIPRTLLPTEMIESVIGWV